MKTGMFVLMFVIAVVIALVFNTAFVIPVIDGVPEDEINAIGNDVNTLSAWAFIGFVVFFVNILIITYVNSKRKNNEVNKGGLISDTRNNNKKQG